MPTCSCRDKCFEKISIHEQHVLRNYYYENSDDAAKNAYLFTLIERKDCKTRICGERKINRNNKYDYYSHKRIERKDKSLSRDGHKKKLIYFIFN